MRNGERLWSSERSKGNGGEAHHLYPMNVKTGFRLLDLARSITDDTLTLLDASSRRFIHEGQIGDAVGSIPYTIREGYGREGNDRKQFLRVARASAEET